MAKKAPGPKEAQLRSFREGKASAVDLDSIKQRLADLEAKKRAELEVERNELLAPLHEQAEAQHQIIKAAQTTLDDIEATIASVTGETRRKRGGGGGARAPKRTPEQLKEIATAVVAHIKSAGKTGTTGGEIISRYGKLLPSVKQFLNLYSDTKVTTTGQKASTRYFLP